MFRKNRNQCSAASGIRVQLKRNLQIRKGCVKSLMNDEKLFADIKCYTEMGKLSVFVGAGVSRLSGYPSWYSLVQSMADEVGCTYTKDKKGNGVFTPEELLKIPQIYYLNKGKDIYRAKVEQGFENSCIPNEIHHLILSLQPNHILTTITIPYSKM